MERLILLVTTVALAVVGPAQALTTEPVPRPGAGRLANGDGGSEGSGSESRSGRLLGVVTDDAGSPLEETLISATGPRGVALAVCDADGRFEFRALHPGRYLLRTHIAGFSAGTLNEVEVRSGLATVHSLALHRVPPESTVAVSFLTAGFSSASALSGTTIEASRSVQPDDTAILAVDPTVERRPGNRVAAPHDDSDKAWHLRRARRSVLKDSGIDLGIGSAAIGSGQPVDLFGGITTQVAAAGGVSNDLPTGFPLSGQLHLLTRASVHSPSQLSSTDILPGQIAYVSLGGPEQQNRWGFQGAVRTGDAGSWVLAGTYLADTAPSHTMAFGMSYSRQQLQAAAVPPSSLLIPQTESTRSAADPSREVGSLSARGSWAAAPWMTLDYSANVAKHGYLEDGSLFSPSAVVTLRPARRSRVHLAVSQYMLAPGAEEFLPPAQGVWLPPERTFAALSPADPLRAERSRHFEVGFEQDFGGSSTVGVRRFSQDVDDQMITMFGFRPEASLASSDHYYLTSAAGVSAEGWGVMFSHVLLDRVRGTVDYSVSNANWAPWAAGGLTPRTVGVFRTGTERFHDVTTTIEAEIPETATRVFLLYRFNTAFSVFNGDAAGGGVTSGLDGRFALRVNQTLPFSPIEGSDWEILVDIRSLFREQMYGASLYDELLVISPPKQVVGGLVVHF